MALLLRALVLYGVAASCGAMRPDHRSILSVTDRVRKAGLTSERSDAPVNESSPGVDGADENVIQKLGLTSDEERVLKSKTMAFFFALTIGVTLLAMLNSCVKAIFRELDGKSWERFENELRWGVLVLFLTVHTLVCYVGTYDTHILHDLGVFHESLTPFEEFCNWAHGNWMQVIFVWAMAWVGWDLACESYFGSRVPVQDQEVFTADDVFTNASEGMTFVTVSFVLQTCLLLILVFVAEYGWKNPAQDVAEWRKALNVILTLALQLYNVGRMKYLNGWQEMMRLRNVRAVQVVDGPKVTEDVVPFTMGDYYVRLVMSLVVNGFFRRYVLLCYPIFMFGYIGSADMLGIVKDLLAIKIVMEVDDLSNAVSLRVTSVAS